jgi:hypothetical protein
MSDMVDDDRLLAWRVDRLRGAGFSEPEATLLACAGNLDLHAVLELIDRGCPPWTAARINAPLDVELPHRGLS